MVSTAAGIMKQSMVANGSTAVPCVNIVCITDAGKKVHFGQATCGYDQLGREVDIEPFGGRNPEISDRVLETPQLGFVRLGTYHLHNVSDFEIIPNNSEKNQECRRVRVAQRGAH